MPYWLFVLHNGLEDVVEGYFNGFVYLLESLGVRHDMSLELASGATLAMVGAAVVWTWARVRAWLRRGAEAARQRLRRQAHARSGGGPGPD